MELIQFLSAEISRSKQGYYYEYSPDFLPQGTIVALVFARWQGGMWSVYHYRTGIHITTVAKDHGTPEDVWIEIQQYYRFELFKDGLANGDLDKRPTLNSRVR